MACARVIPARGPGWLTPGCGLGARLPHRETPDPRARLAIISQAIRDISQHASAEERCAAPGAGRRLLVRALPAPPACSASSASLARPHALTARRYLYPLINSRLDTAPASVVGDTSALYDRMAHLDDQVGSWLRVLQGGLIGAVAGLGLVWSSGGGAGRRPPMTVPLPARPPALAHAGQQADAGMAREAPPLARGRWRGARPLLRHLRQVLLAGAVPPGDRGAAGAGQAGGHAVQGGSGPSTCWAAPGGWGEARGLLGAAAALRLSRLLPRRAALRGPLCAEWPRPAFRLAPAPGLPAAGGERSAVAGPGLGQAQRAHPPAPRGPRRRPGLTRGAPGGGRGGQGGWLGAGGWAGVAAGRPPVAGQWCTDCHALGSCAPLPSSCIRARGSASCRMHAAVLPGEQERACAQY